ncbi:hypothetical protein RDABS01_004416 [Bienertia sinuspersici]
MITHGVPINYDSWNTVIGGCAQNGENTLALELLFQIQVNGIHSNHVTMTSALPACSNLESLRKGKEIHAYIFIDRMCADMTTTIALVYMYAKCGELEISCQIFNMMPRKDVVAWNTIIIANAICGRGEETLLLFISMIIYAVKSNSLSYTGILLVCNHSRLVDEDHYVSLVDILIRVGRLDEAYRYNRSMPMKPTDGAWGALLGGCILDVYILTGEMFIPEKKKDELTIN